MLGARAGPFGRPFSVIVSRLRVVELPLPSTSIVLVARLAVGPVVDSNCRAIVSGGNRRGTDTFRSVAAAGLAVGWAFVV